MGFGTASGRGATAMSKYDEQEAAEACEWITQVIGEDAPEFPAGFKNGVVLCLTVNALKPGSVAKINPGKLPFHRMENIQNFCQAIKKNFGIEDRNNFVTVDLHDEKDLGAVLKTILCLKRQTGAAMWENKPKGDVF